MQRLLVLNREECKAMAVQISGSAVEQFGKKLESFANNLSDEERTLFKCMLDKGSLSIDDLAQVQGGTGGFRTLQFATFAPRLDASFFTSRMCW
jgi:hypothetical protein